MSISTRHTPALSRCHTEKNTPWRTSPARRASVDFHGPVVNPMSPLRATLACAGCHSSRTALGSACAGRCSHASRKRIGAGSKAMPSAEKFARNAARIPCSNDIRAKASSASTSDPSAISVASGSCAYGGVAPYMTIAAAVARMRQNREECMPRSIISGFCAKPMRVPVLFAALFAAALLHAAPASVPSTAELPQYTTASIPAPAVAAQSYFVLDTLSGQTLAAGNAGDKRDPASLTKLMTAYLVFGAMRSKAITPSQMVTVSQKAWRAEGSRMFIEPRKAVSVDELVRGVIVQSGNDASIALAELVAGSEEAFVEKMNREAARLGLAGTHFINSTGVSDARHYSTAADMAQLAAALIRDYPEYYPIYSQKEFRYNNITQPNRNRLLWTDPYVDGVKTGHTEAAGWCLIASAKRGDRRLLAVVLGANSDAARASEAQKRLNWGLQTFDTVQLYQSGKPVSTLRGWKRAQGEVKAGFLADRYLTVPKGKAGNLALTLEAQEPLVAPVARAQRVGIVKVALEGRPVAEFPLIALEDVAPANIFGRAWDTVRLWFAK